MHSLTFFYKLFDLLYGIALFNKNVAAIITFLF